MEISKNYHIEGIFMSRKKYSKELRLQLLKEHIEKGVSYWKLGKDYGIEASTIRRWGYIYDTFGEEGLEKHNSDLCNYSADFKKKVVFEYLAGDISIQNLAYKYKIHAPSTVGSWIKQYNNHAELTNSRKEGVYHMVKNNVRKSTTLEERIRIVEYCIENSEKSRCSYTDGISYMKTAKCSIKETRHYSVSGKKLFNYLLCLLDG